MNLSSLTFDPFFLHLPPPKKKEAYSHTGFQISQIRGKLLSHNEIGETPDLPEVGRLVTGGCSSEDLALAF